MLQQTADPRLTQPCPHSAWQNMGGPCELCIANRLAGHNCFDCLEEGRFGPFCSSCGHILTDEEVADLEGEE